MKKTFIFCLSFIVAFVQIVLLGCKYPIGHCNASAGVFVIMKKDYIESYIIKSGVIPEYRLTPDPSDFHELKPYDKTDLNYWIDTLGDKQEYYKFLKNNKETHTLYHASHGNYDFELGGSSNPNAHYKFGEDWNYVFYFHIFDKDENLLETLVHSITIPYDKSYYVSEYFNISTSSFGDVHFELHYDISYAI